MTPHSMPAKLMDRYYAIGGDFMHMESDDIFERIVPSPQGPVLEPIFNPEDLTRIAVAVETIALVLAEEHEWKVNRRIRRQQRIDRIDEMWSWRWPWR